jgi:hypothetical protein
LIVARAFGFAILPEAAGDARSLLRVGGFLKSLPRRGTSRSVLKLFFLDFSISERFTLKNSRGKPAQSRPASYRA